MRGELNAQQVRTAHLLGGYYRDTRMTFAGRPMVEWTAAPVQGPRCLFGGRGGCPGPTMRRAFAARGLHPLTGERS